MGALFTFASLPAMEPSAGRGVAEGAPPPPPPEGKGKASSAASPSAEGSDSLDAECLVQEHDTAPFKVRGRGKGKGKGKGKDKGGGKNRASLDEADAKDRGGPDAESLGTPSLLEGLPELPSLQGGPRSLSWARGPHETCNYLLPGRLLAGSYPGDRSEPDHSRKILALLEAGVNTFVCLQQRRELQRFTPYVGRAKELYAALDGAGDRDLEVLSCEIPDVFVTSRHNLAVALATVVDRLRQGRVVYVHCWGGHGRTGTLLCAFLAKAYGLTVEQAKDYFLATHGQRQVRNGGGPGHWPHCSEQYEQARSFEGDDSELVDELLGPLEDW